jgi:hypothetical protein
MTVQELLDELNKVDDKSITVCVLGCYASEGDIGSVSISEVGEADDQPNKRRVVLYSDICSG